MVFLVRAWRPTISTASSANGATATPSSTSGTSIGVVRAISRSTTSPNAPPVQPRLDVAARPHSAIGLLGILLRCAIPAARILRPIQRKTVPRQPFPKIGIADLTRRNRPAVAVEADWQAGHRPSRDEGVEIVRGLRAAAVLQAVVIPQSWVLSGASMPQSRMRVPWISRVSPSMTLRLGRSGRRTMQRWMRQGR